MRRTRRSLMLQSDTREERSPPKACRERSTLREAEDGVRREIAALLHAAAGPMDAGEIARRLGYPLATIVRCLGVTP